uniref:CER1-like n=1 Tax=Oryza sativa subsp. japonica TaxID=39947 RepID=Q6K3M9_ORYSJ|nr:CER1-like [Oryza sativa Japonica Group]
MALEGEQTPGQATEAAREMDGDGGRDGGEWRREVVKWFHSLHHTQFRTNYSLYMPFYDYIYNTMDKSSSTLYESMLKISKEKSLDVVHLTHLTDLQSIYHLRPGFSMFAARGYNQSNWSMITILSPLSWLIAMCTWAFSSSPFAVDRSVLDKNLNMQTWAIPRYSFHYHLKRENKAINDLIGKAIHEADRRGAKVFSLGLLNQGSSLAAAVVSNSVASRTDQVILAGNLDKVARAVAMALCKRNVKIRWEALEVSVAKGIMWRQRGHRGMDGGDIGDGEARATVELTVEKQSSQEVSSQSREDDVLTKALGTEEHRGRTRGIGSSVPWKLGFPQYAWQYKKHKLSKAQKYARLKEQLRAELREELRE